MGRNIYAPTLIKDGSIYKLWYGGWQTDSDYPFDKIYYRTSNDNSNWSDYVVVLTPDQIGAQVEHVNDPSVTKHYNSINKSYQYTMFYTVCRKPCTSQSDNQIWSSVSSDGINWSYHQVLLDGFPGPAEPSAILAPHQSDGTFWKVYYVDRLDSTKVKMVKVDGNRRALSAKTVYEHPGGGGVSGAEVRYIGGSWYLFFNAFFPDRVDIYKSTSTSNESWPPIYEILIQNSGGFCATMTPGVLAYGTSIDIGYDLYFGLTPSLPGGGCRIDQQQSIQRWRWLLR